MFLGCNLWHRCSRCAEWWKYKGWRVFQSQKTNDSKKSIQQYYKPKRPIKYIHIYVAKGLPREGTARENVYIRSLAPTKQAIEKSLKLITEVKHSKTQSEHKTMKFASQGMKQFSVDVESNSSDTIWFSLLYDWSTRLVPSSRPIRCKS